GRSIGNKAGGEMSIYRFASAALVCAAVLAPSGLRAQTYPSKPIHFVLPYIPGGIIDTAGRHLALRLSESLGQPVVPENRPGAGGRCRCGGALGAGRLHDAADGSRARLQPDAATGRPLRPVQGTSGGLDRRLLAGGDRRVAQAAG